MATVTKDFKVKNGLIVEGTTGTINNHDILTKKEDDQNYIIGLIGGTATSTNTANAVVKRDGSGNFAAGTVTADLVGDVTGNADTASALETARTISLAGNVTGSTSFDGSGNVTITATIDSSFATDAEVATAKGEAISTASSDATSKANAAQAAAEATAAADATSKANAAQAAAEATAAADATSKANAAQAAAIASSNTYTDGKVADLVDAAPDLLNTLNELAAAIGDNPNYATDLATSVGTKVSKAGDTMTGLLVLSADPSAALGAATKQYVDAAEADAVSTASADATSKANAAQAAAEATASADATSKANAAQAAAEATASADATSKANAAQAAAEATAAADATSKANAAQAAAIASSNTYTDGKVADLVDAAPDLLNTLNELAAAIGDNPNYATDLATSVGTKVSKAGDTMTGLLVLSADPSAALGAATKQYVDAAEADAVSTASADATSKANAAQAAAEATASADATSKANAAQAAAEATASADATSKANAAQAAAIAHADALDTDDIAEGSNEYFTSARAKTAAAELLTGATLSNITITGTGAGLTITAENGVAQSTTADLAEDPSATGSSGTMYFTDARAVSALEAVVPNFTAVELNSIAKQVAATASIATASTNNAVSWDKAEYRSAEFLVKIANGSHTDVSKVILTLDTSDNVAITEYAMVGTNGNLGNVSADVSGNDVRLRVQTLNNNSTVAVIGTLLA